MMKITQSKVEAKQSKDTTLVEEREGRTRGK